MVQASPFLVSTFILQVCTPTDIMAQAGGKIRATPGGSRLAKCHRQSQIPKATKRMGSVYVCSLSLALFSTCLASTSNAFHFWLLRVYTIQRYSIVLLDGLHSIWPALVDDRSSAKRAATPVIVHLCFHQLTELRKQFLQERKLLTRDSSWEDTTQVVLTSDECAQSHSPPKRNYLKGLYSN